MMLARVARIAVLSTVVLASGCVFPNARTYFVVNPDDGTPVTAQTCGPFTNNKVAVSRTFADTELIVHPTFDSSGRLLVSLFMENNRVSSLRFVPDMVDVRLENA